LAMVVIKNFWLVVEPPLRKNMKVTWGYDIPNRWKNKTCSKPPTSNNLMLCPTVFLQGGASLARRQRAMNPERPNHQQPSAEFTTQICAKTQPLRSKMS
jgi:hypothetical protein